MRRPPMHQHRLALLQRPRTLSAKYTVRSLNSRPPRLEADIVRQLEHSVGCQHATSACRRSASSARQRGRRDRHANPLAPIEPPRRFGSQHERRVRPVLVETASEQRVRECRTCRVHVDHHSVAGGSSISANSTASGPSSESPVLRAWSGAYCRLRIRPRPAPLPAGELAVAHLSITSTTSLTRRRCNRIKCRAAGSRPTAPTASGGADPHQHRIHSQQRDTAQNERHHRRVQRGPPVRPLAATPRRNRRCSGHRPASRRRRSPRTRPAGLASAGFGIGISGSRPITSVAPSSFSNAAALSLPVEATTW